MPMKPRIFLSLGLVAALSGAAQAATPPNSGTLGALDAWVNVCSKLAPAGAGAYEKYEYSLIGNPPAATLATLRATPEYKQAYVFMRDLYLTEVTKSNVRGDCLTTIGKTGPVG